MKKRLNSQTEATKRNRAKIQRNVAKSQQLLCSISALSRGSHFFSRGQGGWYHQRRRASQRLRSLSRGTITFYEDGFRGDMQRHWMKNEVCEHVFKASLKEIYSIGHEKICPFCTVTSDLRRFGSIGAVQEHVYRLSHGNIEFMPENVLGSSSDDYLFSCNIHHFIFEKSFHGFLEAPTRACHICIY